MMPAQQGLGSNELSVFDLRLIEEHELLGLDAPPQIFLHGCAGIHGGLQSGSKEEQGIFTRGLRLIKGDIGLLQNLIQLFTAVPENADPDAAGADSFATLDVIRPVDCCKDLFSDDLRLRGGDFGSLAEVFKQEEELIGTDPARGVDFADADAKALGGFAQHKVANLMAEGVVQCLEIVEIDEQQRPLAMIAGAGGDALAQALHQEAAIGQPGQRIEEGQVSDLLFRQLYVGEIADDRKDAAHAIDLNHRCRHEPPKDLSVFSSEESLKIPAARCLAGCAT